MKFKKIAILGGGNLGTSIARGLLRSQNYSDMDIVISEIRERRIDFLKGEGFQVVSSNIDAVKDAELILIAVKPQQMDELLDEIKGAISIQTQLINYTVSGYTLSEVEARVGKIPVFKIMPNTAIEICQSMTCISALNASEELITKVVNLYKNLGEALLIEEKLMASATVLGSCGIAYALRFMRAATQGGIEIGFHAELSQLITAQTLKGAAQLILESGTHPEEEIDKVTTPQGITISGLNEMEHQGFSSALIKGLIASYNKLLGLK